MNKDLKDFQSEITWFFRKPEEIILLGQRTFHASFEFEEKYPILTKLLKKARITTIKYEEQRYELFGWYDKDNNSLGWLCNESLELEDKEIKKSLHPDHVLLLRNFGGITERWNEPVDTWLCNLNYALPYENAEVGINGWEESFEEYCKDEGIEIKINPRDYITFAVEANGNVTMYHKESGEILMYAHDHAFNHIYPFHHYPEYTLYRIENCNTLKEWVETIAGQWLTNII
ncbi:hypothetical protein [Litchfieldia salsa]|uniref:Uncharacterized protein n=1 Tax=Litchfieldia salsa TaxID=930152 RepID=A0A1H0W8P1_9BACI|nr:hypothetical protein [Litchfieldia salsa]SDP86755.1 hypothetical protein SAMN05216565_109167 [Litchfieldia salsa]